jgi:hypothetical protein
VAELERRFVPHALLGAEGWVGVETAGIVVAWFNGSAGMDATAAAVRWAGENLSVPEWSLVITTGS